ncbi:MAG TPA: CHAD domain-containing protein [Ramlibacter sp.]|nr:CHAD domain-containing protein [Ramlibacter sp.]
MEREVKFEVPATALPALREALQSAPTHTLALRALYYDTADGALARHGLSLRLRKEGRAWVQTVKGPGASMLERAEFNVAVKAGPRGAAPLPDVSRHHGTPAQTWLLEALAPRPGAPAAPLSLQFEVKVERQLRLVSDGGALVELALDTGRIEAGGRSQPLCEFELELKQGDVADLLRLARQWRQQHGLWLSQITKAAKGRRLAEGAACGPPVTAQALHYPARASSGEVAAAALMSCLAQVIGNSSELAGGAGGDEHVHQARVGIRRLRTALRELRLLVGAQVAHDPPLVEAFRVLGAWRDQTHVLVSVAPQFAQAGGPALEPAPAQDLVSPADAVCAPAFQDTLLALLALAGTLEGEGSGPARQAIRPVLDRLWGQVIRQGHRFTALDDAAQHRVRKRLKRLRYLAEFVAPLFARRRVGRFLEQLKPVQDALGTYNDEGIALSVYRGLVADDARAWFGVGWLAARRDSQARASRKALRRLADARAFWH